MYQSSATVVLVQNENSEQETTDNSSITQNDITLNKNLLSTYIKIATSDKVLERVISELNLDISLKSLKNLVSVESVNSTQVLKITVSNANKELAPEIANHLLNVFSEEVQSLYNMNNIYTMDKAEVSDTPYNINHIKDLTLFVMFGFVLAAIFVFVVYIFDSTIKSEKDVEDYTDLSVLSSIPLYNSKNNKINTELIVDEEPKSPISECFKTFRTNVMFSIQNKKLNTVLVTSGFMGEGKSFVSSNLATTFAHSGKKVILVDTDMRKGRLHKIFDLSNETGLSTCLSKIGSDGKLVNINEYIKESKIPNLHIMTSGIVPPNPSELLSSYNMQALLNALNKQYDIVICDGTPCMLVSDSIILSKIVDTTVIVTANKTTKLDTLLKIQKSIEMVGGNIGGVVVNKMDVNPKSYKNSYYYGENIHYNVKKEDFVHDTCLDTPLYIDDLTDSVDKDDTPIIATTEINLDNSNISIDNLSNLIDENKKEILDLKSTYKDTVQNIMDLIKNTDYSTPVINELNNIKEDLSNVLLKQSENLQGITTNYENKFDEIMVKQAEELQNISSIYQNKFDEINNKINNINFVDTTDLISDKFTDVDNKIDILNNKLENIKEADFSSFVFNKLNDFQDEYHNYVKTQNNDISLLNNKLDELNKKFANLKNNDNSEILNEMFKIYNKLEFINNKFEHLEERANNNEFLISNLSNEVKNNLSKPKHSLDIDKLNNKVIQIQDYLENSSKPIIENDNIKIKNKNRNKAKNILDGQLNIIDNLLNNSINVEEDNTKPNTDIKQDEELFIVDYSKENEKEKPKQTHKSFSLFKNKNNNNLLNEDEEPVEIVSQILLNNNEYAG
jgi:capsular exopolysaccharide synthesis family protein